MDAISNATAHVIVVGADGSEAAEQAVVWAAREAVISAATLRIVSAWSMPTIMWPASMNVGYIDPADIRAGALAILARARTLALHAAGGQHLDIETAEACSGSVEYLLGHAAGAALLVVGSRGRGGFANLVLGSVAATCAHHSPVPLAVIGPDAPLPGTGEIVVGVDDSAGGRAALRWAAGEARVVDAGLRVVQGWEIPVAPGAGPLGVGWEPDRDEAALRDLHRVVDEEIDRSSTQPTIEVSALLQSVPEALVIESKDAAMLVVGSRGRGGFRELLLGSVSQHCLHHACCPVVIVPTASQAAKRQPAVSAA